MNHDPRECRQSGRHQFGTLAGFKSERWPGIRLELLADFVGIRTVVELIGATTTKTGLKVESALDTRTYQKGIKVSKDAMKSLDITGDQFHPEWNYVVRPRQTTKS